MTELRQRVHHALARNREWSETRDLLRLQSPATRPGRHLEIQFRPDGDVDVAYFLDGVKGTPFEQHFTVCGEPVDQAAIAIVRFADDLTCERLVLVWAKGLSGGRRFVPLAETRSARWVSSWRGTYDRDLPLQRQD